MEMKLFGLIETKLFNFLRILINGGGGGAGRGFEWNPSRSATVVCGVLSA